MFPIRIALVTDNKSITPLPSVIGVTVEDCFAHPRQLLTKLGRNKIHYDLILVDCANMIEVTRKLLALLPTTKIVAVFNYVDAELAILLMQLGVAGIILRQEMIKNLSQFSKSIYIGKVVISQPIMKKILEHHIE